MQHIVFRRFPSLLQIRHNAPRNAPLPRELALLDMNEVSSRTLSGHLCNGFGRRAGGPGNRSEEHTSELQSLMRISYAVFCLKKKKTHQIDLKQYPNTKDYPSL